MTLAIQWGYDATSNPTSRGFIYFDAVTSFDRSYTGSVSKHPIDKGGSVSDHFTRDNPIFTFTGVISGVDISYSRVVPKDYNGNTPTNYKQAPDAVKVKKNSNQLLKLLPDTIGQYFKPTKPEITLASQPDDIVLQVRDTIASLFTEDKTNLVTLYEYDGGNLRKKPIENLVMTSFKVREDTDTGEALYCDITLEQITFSTSQKASVPAFVSESLVADDIKQAAQAEVDKGKQDSTSKGIDDEKSIAKSGGDWLLSKVIGQ